jgi:hypothetical protein
VKVIIRTVLHSSINQHTKEPIYTVYSTDMSKYCDQTMIAEQQVEFDVPESFDPVVAEVERLKAEKTRKLAEAQAEQTRIDERIQSLLAIENKS